MCWNYRGYGMSEMKLFETLNPYLCKMDAERVLEFMVNKMKLRGKLGVYGRSLGGISACHLAQKYENLIYVLLTDRTFGELEHLCDRRLIGWTTKWIYKAISCNWKTENDVNFANVNINTNNTIQAKCYKIITCDSKDDVVDNYASLAAGVVKFHAKQNYSDPKWLRFYEAIKFLYDIESILFSKLSDRD